MTQFGKARWSIDKETLRMGMDFSKVDKKRRMVYGWATLDNVDTDNDVVTADASADAFARSRGNLREMHKKDSAVGRVVSFKEDTFRAPDGNEYRGIFVKVRVSEGAENTWKKVLDGTLNGFSIGGDIEEAVEDFAKDGSTKIRKVIKYNLNELSLVDNPGNQYSDITNVFKLRKSADGSVTSVSGMVEDVRMLNVFYCQEDGITKEVAGEFYLCPVCDNQMTFVDYIEDAGDREGKVSNLITKFVGGGGENMRLKKTINDPERDESEETGNETGDPQEVPTPARTDEVDEVSPEEDQEPKEVTEVHDAADELTKTLGTLKKDISEILNKSSAEHAEKIAALEEIVKSATAEFNKKASELDAKVTELDKNLGITKSKLNALESGLEKMNSAGALKKSVDSDKNPTELEQKNDPWDGSALSLYGVLHRS